jgi:hypothetical protein
MSTHFYDNEFEKYLKEKASQHRMYPSDQVWRNIQNEIHGYRKWPALTFLSILILSALVVGTVLVKPHTQLATVLPNTVENKNIEKTLPKLNVDGKKNYMDHIAVENITQQTISKAIETVQTKRIQESSIVITPVHLQADINSALPKNVGGQHTLLVSANKVIQLKNEEMRLVNNNLTRTTFVYSSFLRRNLNAKAPLSKEYFNFNPSFANHAESIEPNEVDSRFNFVLINTQRNTSSSSFIKFNSNSSHFDFQFYVTPSISYRRLVDDAQGKLSRSYITALPFAGNYMIDVNRVIRHTSAAGYEIGLSLGYNLNTKFALRSGFQFNMREYDIDAYVHPIEPATIALVSRSSSDIFNTVTGFRNTAGSSPIVLKNRYYEISLPIGIDWRPVNEKFSWGVAASIQPTYTFDKEPFIITSNFKNYADGSQLMRNWNLNTSFETYLGYNTGKYRWQIGPQIRYQLLPTMTNSYPIREYLVDYGIKLGLTRSLK